MAMRLEGGVGADVHYISPSDNGGAGAWVSNQLDDYPDGTRVKLMFWLDLSCRGSVDPIPMTSRL
jgi:hypothetical protein